MSTDGKRLHWELRDKVAWLTLDDGKANAMQGAFLAQFEEALNEIAADVRCHVVVVTGRPSFFSAGLDLKLLPTLSGPELAQTTEAFARAMRRAFLFPKPIVAASTGHAIAGGMMLYLAADSRLALRGEKARYGLNEATNGLPLVGGTMGLCQFAIPTRHHTELILHGRMIGPEGTVERGLTNELFDSVEDLHARAQALAESLFDVKLDSYAINKRLLRESAWSAAVETAKVVPPISLRDLRELQR